MWLACAARRKIGVLEKIVEKEAHRLRQHVHFLLKGVLTPVTGKEQYAVYDAKLWHKAVHVSMFCPDGESRLFCFDEKSSLNIRWRSFCILFS